MTPRKITNYNGTLANGATVTIAENLARTKIKIWYFNQGTVGTSNPELEIYGAGYPSGTPLIFHQKDVTSETGLVVEFETTSEITLKSVHGSTITGYYNVTEILYG